MINKYFILSISLVVINWFDCYSQISNEKEFIEFALSSPSQKFNSLLKNKWTTLNDKQWGEDGKMLEEHKYAKKENEKLYILTMLYVLDGGTLEKRYSTKISYTDVNTYNKWIKNMKEMGYVFKEYEKGKYSSSEEGYTIYYGKKMANKSIVYEFEVISY